MSSLALIAALLLAAPTYADDEIVVAMSLHDQKIVVERGNAREKRIVPGSVMKLFTAYALLEIGRDHALHECRGKHVDALGEARECWIQRGHGEMNLRTALADSCNVWFYENAQYLDDQRLLAIYRAFGFGEGDLLPGAIPARDLPDVAVGDHLAMRVTPLSLLRAVSLIALRGRGTELDPRHLELIAEGMAEAAKGGTLAGVFAQREVAAKTGTAKKEGMRGTRALVIGFFPPAKPRFAFVVVKESGRGAIDAGPIAARLTAELAR
jgi:cell division protein FtsI/penicillin-binding protein 2